MQLITKAQSIENSAITLLARIVNADADVVEVDDIDTIAVKVFDMATGTQIGTTAAPDAEDVIDTLSTDGWTEDGTGYNFKMVLSGDSFPSGDTTYRVELKFKPNDGDAFYALWELQTTGVLSE